MLEKNKKIHRYSFLLRFFQKIGSFFQKKTVDISKNTDKKTPKQLEGLSQLEVKGLQKRFGSKLAVDGVDFSMNRGEVVGLLGPNGAGKTTVFYMIAGFISANRGDIYLNQENIKTLPMYKRARLGIAYLPQEASVFHKLTVKQNILAVVELRKDLTQAQREYLVDELLDKMGLRSLAKQMAFSLSGGERRRTEIARALATNPYFLLLDEPFAGIDPIAIAEVKTIIDILSQQKIGILLTDHNVREALSIVHRAYILYQGKILIHGNYHDIIHNPEARELYLGHEFTL